MRRLSRSLPLAAVALFPALLAPRAVAGQAELAGTYRYHGGSTLAIVPGDTMLFAIAGEGKYPLRFIGGDRVINGPGDTIPFRRDAAGAVSGFVERGTFFARLSSEVDPAAAALVHARPRGAAPWAYRPPEALGDGIAVGSLADAGLDASLARTLADGVANGTYPDVHGILVYRNGRLVLEEYFYGYDRDRPHQMRSATKSVVSALVGIAIDGGALSGVDERVLARLPYAAYANPHPRKEALTLADLLTHRTGLPCHDWDPASPGNEQRVYQQDDWVKYFLDLPVTGRGDTARYCSAGILTAGRMVERATGEALPVYARRVLFEPLGIRPEHVRWDFTLSDENAETFAQANLRPRDMLKLGLLFARGGRWNGRQVVSEAWVRSSIAEHSRVGDQGYGYAWWHQWFNVETPSGIRRVETIMASGNGGQKIYLIPSLDAVAVFTGGAFNAGSSPPNAMMSRVLLPALLASGGPSTTGEGR